MTSAPWIGTEMGLPLRLMLVMQLAAAIDRSSTAHAAYIAIAGTRGFACEASRQPRRDRGTGMDNKFCTTPLPMYLVGIPIARSTV